MASADITVDVRAGADPYELGATIALCGGIEGAGPPSLPALAPPAGWNMLFDSPVIGDFENKWQLWKSPGGRYAVVIRGTVCGNFSSILEDLMAVMIPATGSIQVAAGRLPYSFAQDPKAAVHLGFAIGALLLMLDGTNGILAKIQSLVPGGSHLIITGHSQGAAIATLVRAYFEHAEPALMVPFDQSEIRTYLWAQPKPGNDHFARDFERIIQAYRITNSEDWVPQLPLSLQLLASLNGPNPLSVLPGEGLVKLFEAGLGILAHHVEGIHTAKFLPQILGLDVATLYPPAAKTVIPGRPGAPVDIAGGLNFEPAGIPITLTGKPGLDPANAGDSWWQHHAAMYASLLPRPG